MAQSISPLPLLENHAFEPFLDFGKPYPTKSFSLDSSIGGHDGKTRHLLRSGPGRREPVQHADPDRLDEMGARCRRLHRSATESLEVALGIDEPIHRLKAFETLCGGRYRAGNSEVICHAAEYERVSTGRKRKFRGLQHREFCDIFGPEHILENADEFLNYFMFSKVVNGAGTLRASGTVIKKLAKWLAENGHVRTDDAALAIGQGAEAARSASRGRFCGRGVLDSSQRGQGSRPL